MLYTALISLFCYLPACLVAVYVILHFLLPLLQDRKYFRFILGLSLLAFALVTLNYFTSILFYSLTCDCPLSSIKVLQILGQDFINTAHAIIAGGIVLGIKIAKEWIVKQKENQRLIMLKISNELQLQKARIYPGFLFQSLESLSTKMISGSPDSPKIILRLSDLLNYLLYESSEELIPLEKELDMIANLLSIEKMNQAHHLTIHSQITATSDGKFIRPLILFPLLQNCFEILGSREKEQCVVYFETTIVDQILNVSLRVEQASEKSNLIEWSQSLKNVWKRVSFLNEVGHELKIENSKGGSKINLGLVLADKVYSHI
jgi:LytS/YehU family sensor histidine kinase